MPGEILGDGLHFRLGGCLLHATTKAGGSLLLLEDGFHLLTILRHDCLLSLEVLPVEVLTKVRVGEDGITAVRLVDRLQEQPTADKALIIRLCRLCGSRRKILRTILELYPIDAEGTISLVGNHQVGNTLRCVL